MKTTKMKTTIKKMGINGEGIGYIDKTPVFIPGALIDEFVEFEVLQKEKRFMRGKLVEVIKPSKDRIQPSCKIQHRCGACTVMTMRYKAQLEYKQDNLKQSLIKYAQVNPRLVERTRASEHQMGYRNQCKMPIKKVEKQIETGMYMSGSNYFIDVKKCIVHEDGVDRVRNAVTSLLDKHRVEPYDRNQKRGARSLVVRGFDEKYQVTLVTGDEKLKPELIEDIMGINGVISLWQSIHTQKNSVDIFGNNMIHLAGESVLKFEFDGLDLQVSPRSFFQMNTSQAIELYRLVKELVGDNNNLIVEAYSGIGAISLYLHDKAKQIIGIEINKDAVNNANANARANKVENVKFLCDDAGNKLSYIAKKEKIDAIIVDPPRTGLDDQMLETLLKSKAKQIVYVSCNPATLGKDISILSDRYRVERVVPFDMFPQTQHVETVVLMSRANK